ncbi:NAD(P) transhydrogenase subunit alpha [Salinivirga cyanobacteriivorans]|uniref:NAD(P) transhydrogenase subunit alpha part 1 n=1 Tax=Salinivirga cyanobacteriivorans TaxID=1307839 RepID=A0A0S2I621_9BACT|nr:Re/Si-specific NAD(P)(+) transhydrogenase subunit alpha [Salinivirga cyanobacteriivorans]ALO17420.1 NAD(P) transhydrogenase subunit alpha [Salinivirga cyanobacteriivorans]
MKIGLLREPDFEHRVALLPEAVQKLEKKGHQVLFEPDAGAKAFAPDSAYTENGAVATKRTDILKNAELILTIQPLPVKELDHLQKGQVVVGVYNPLVNKELVNQFKEKGLTLLSLDNLPRTTRAQAMDILSSMATVAGYKSVLEAANRVPRFFPMFMSAAGTIKPAKMLILGAGVAGLQAIGTARKLGAVVEVFDVRAAVKEEVQSLGGKFIEVEGAKDDKDAGGYAVEQSDDFKNRQQEKIQEHAIKSDVIITTAQIPGKPAPKLITKASIEQMKPGSVIIDIAASSGGNTELTQDNKVVNHNGVMIVGNSQISSDMADDASRMFGNNVINFLEILTGENSALKLNFEDDIIAGCTITHEGDLISERIRKAYKN